MKDCPLRIVLLDDKEFGVAQIRNALPSDLYADIIWFPDLDSFRQNTEIFDILFLDYYLDNDHLTSDNVFREVRKRARKVIAFSSSSSSNKKLLACGAHHAVEKIWSDTNPPLTDLLLEIL